MCRVMLERVLRTCPDGAIFPFFLQATGVLKISWVPQCWLYFLLPPERWQGSLEVRETVSHPDGHSFIANVPIKDIELTVREIILTG